MNQEPIIIIGAGIAGISAIKAIREENSNIKVILIHNEDRLPYKRTKVNKNFITGFDKNDFALFDENWYTNFNIELLQGDVSKIDTNQNTIVINHKTILSYSKLLIATGSENKFPTISGLNTQNSLSIRTAADAEKLITQIKFKKNILIIGGGVEGIEIAEQLRRLKCNITVNDISENILSLHFDNKFSTKIQNDLEEQGIRFHLGENIENLIQNSELIEVKWKGGIETYDQIIIAIGSTPRTKIAQAAGIACQKGIIINDYLQTNIKNIYAAGDVCQLHNNHIPNLWHEAENMGYIAGKNMLDNAISYIVKPFRLKTELFNQFYFSANYQNTKLKGFYYEENENIARKLFIENSCIIGGIMYNDKNRAKIYQQAIFENWSLSQFLEEVPIK